MSKFKVLREHKGDRMYRTGDIREAADATVAHLVRNGVLQKMLEEPRNKMAPEVANKASARPSSTPRHGSPTGAAKPSSSSRVARQPKPLTSRKSEDGAA